MVNLKTCSLNGFFFVAQPSLRSWRRPCSYCTRKPISYPHLPLVSILSSSFSLSTLKSWGFQTHCCHWRTFSRRFSLVESSILYKKLSMENPKKAKKLPNRVILKLIFTIYNQGSWNYEYMFLRLVVLNGVL